MYHMTPNQWTSTTFCIPDRNQSTGLLGGTAMPKTSESIPGCKGDWLFTEAKPNLQNTPLAPALCNDAHVPYNASHAQKAMQMCSLDARQSVYAACFLCCTDDLLQHHTSPAMLHQSASKAPCNCEVITSVHRAKLPGTKSL